MKEFLVSILYGLTHYKCEIVVVAVVVRKVHNIKYKNLLLLSYNILKKTGFNQNSGDNDDDDDGDEDEGVY